MFSVYIILHSVLLGRGWLYYIPTYLHAHTLHKCIYALKQMEILFVMQGERKVHLYGEKKKTFSTYILQSLYRTFIVFRPTCEQMRKLYNIACPYTGPDKGP